MTLSTPGFGPLKAEKQTPVSPFGTRNGSAPASTSASTA